MWDTARAAHVSSGSSGTHSWNGAGLPRSAGASVPRLGHAAQSDGGRFRQVTGLAYSLFRTSRILGELRFGSDVGRLHDSGIHGRDDIHCAVQVVVGDPGFPCVRKASLHSVLAVPSEGHSEPHEHLLPLAQVVDSVSLSIEFSKIRPLRHHALRSEGRCPSGYAFSSCA